MENKHLANPCSTDSTPTSANQEDHVSMAAHGARRLKRMNANLSQIIGIEAMCAAAGVDNTVFNGYQFFITTRRLSIIGTEIKVQ